MPDTSNETHDVTKDFLGMKRITTVFFSIVIFISLCSCVSINNSNDSMEVFGGDYKLKSNEVLKGDLLLVNSTGVLEEGSIVNGDVVVIGGTIHIYGNVKGNLLIFGGETTTEESSTINSDVSLTGGSLLVGGNILGDISSIGGVISFSDTAVVKGNITSFAGSIDRTNLADLQGRIIGTATDRLWQEDDPSSLPVNIFTDLESTLKIPFKIFLILLWSGLGALMVLIFPNALQRVSKAIIDQPLACTGIGLFTIIIGVAASLTILLLPIICLFSPIFISVLIFGKIGLGLAVGKKIEPSFSSPISPAIIAGIGILLIELVSLLLDLIPCVGWIGGFVLSIIGIGAAVVTVFGTRPYPRMVFTQDISRRFLDDESKQRDAIQAKP